MTGNEEFKTKMDALSKRIGDNVAKAVMKGAQMVRTDAIKSIQTPSAGKNVVRWRNGKPKNRVASYAGLAPNTDTGALVKSIQVEVAPQYKGAFVGSNLEYAGHLENGTATMKPRPWLEPAYNKNVSGIKKLISAAILKEIT